MQETKHPVLMSRSVVSHSVTPRTTARQAPRSIAFPRLEYWSESPFPSPGDLPDPGIEPTSPAWQADSSPQPPGKIQKPCYKREGEKKGNPWASYNPSQGLSSVDGRVGGEAPSLEKEPCCVPGPHQFLLNASSEACWYWRLLTRSARPACLRSRKAQRTGHGNVRESCHGRSALRAEQALGKFLISLSFTELP